MNHKTYLALIPMTFLLISLLSCKNDNAISASTSDNLSNQKPLEIDTIEPYETLLEDTLQVISKVKEKANSEDKTVIPTKSVDTKPAVKKKTTPRKAKKRKPKPKAEISFEKLEIDFGEITQGDTVDFKFKFVNTGKGPLEVTSAVGTCGCTVPSFPFLAIPPGEEGFIGVKYISIGKEGDQSPSIAVESNGSSDPVTLFMKGHVKVPLTKEPNKLDSISGN